MSTLFQVKKLTFSYGMDGHKEKYLFNGLNISIKEGEFVGLTGPSGSGKSTLLNILGLIEELQSGDVIFSGESFNRCSEKRKNHLRLNTFGFIFQDFHLVETLSVLENVQFFPLLQGIDRRRAKIRSLLALRRVGLFHLHDRKTSELSGGQRQRVAIARALAKRPKIIIADEPTASLDQASGTIVMDTLKYLNEVMGVTIIVASHDHIIENYVDRVINIVDGKINNSNEAFHATEIFAT